MVLNATLSVLLSQLLVVTREMFPCARRTATARGKAELADLAADHAREDSEIARSTAKQFAPDFQQPGEKPRTSFT